MWNSRCWETPTDIYDFICKVWWHYTRTVAYTQYTRVHKNTHTHTHIYVYSHARVYTQISSFREDAVAMCARASTPPQSEPLLAIGLIKDELSSGSGVVYSERNYFSFSCVPVKRVPSPPPPAYCWVKVLKNVSRHSTFKLQTIVIFVILPLKCAHMIMRVFKCASQIVFKNKNKKMKSTKHIKQKCV